MPRSWKFSWSDYTSRRQADMIRGTMGGLPHGRGKTGLAVDGGGHARAGTPTNGGFDCSGSVAAVLAAGGLWPKAGAVGSDLGLVQELKSRGLIATGPGSGPDQVTLYDHPGKTIEMSIDGRAYGVGGDSKG